MRDRSACCVEALTALLNVNISCRIAAIELQMAAIWPRSGMKSAVYLRS